MPPQKRETEKIVELGGRKFKIGKFDALTGSYMAFMLLTKALPFGMESQMPMPFPSNRVSMTKSEFVDFQRDCLSVISELKDVGGVEAPMPILMPDGRWGVEGLENDTITIVGLTVHSLLFNVAGFFEEGVLKELTESLSSSISFSTPT